MAAPQQPMQENSTDSITRFQEYIKKFNCNITHQDTSSWCYNDDPEGRYKLFGSWTSYFAVDNERAEKVEIPGCTPKSFWQFVRHGSRKPSIAQIDATNERGPIIRDAILQNHQEGQGEMCGKDIGAFQDWQPNLTHEDDHLLVQSGRDEMKQLGQRFKARFPTLFDKFDPKEVVFRSTKTQRTIESAREFFEGAFQNFDFELPEPILNDTVLRFYKFCKNFKDLDNIPEGSELLAEQRLFEQGPEIAGLIDRVNQRLGFASSDEVDENSECLEGDCQRLSFKDIYVMWDTCRFQMQALRTPVFCAPFTTEDLEIMEYHEELKYWRSHGYGPLYEELDEGKVTLNSLVACPLMKNLVNGLVNNRVTVHFGHQDGLTTLLTMLGINEDSHYPKHDNYPNLGANLDRRGPCGERKYRMSKMNPMGGNLAVVRFECEQEPLNRVVAYLQEKPINICTQGPERPHTECSWERFKYQFQEAIQCPYDEVCGNMN